MKEVAVNLITAWFLAVMLLGIAMYDLVAQTVWGDNGTISRVIVTLAMRHPIITLAIGIIIGHMLWPQVVYLPAESEVQ